MFAGAVPSWMFEIDITMREQRFYISLGTINKVEHVARTDVAVLRIRGHFMLGMLIYDGPICVQCRHNFGHDDYCDWFCDYLFTNAFNVFTNAFFKEQQPQVVGRETLTFNSRQKPPSSFTLSRIALIKTTSGSGPASPPTNHMRRGAEQNKSRRRFRSVLHQSKCQSANKQVWGICVQNIIQFTQLRTPLARNDFYYDAV